MEHQYEGLERRMVHRLLRRWRAAATGDHPPTLEDLYQQDLNDLLEHIIVAEVSDGSAEPTVRVVGSAFRSADVPDPTGHPVSAIQPTSLSGRAVAHYRTVLERRVPIALSGKIRDASGRTYLYRSIILPICQTGERISHLVCAANGKLAPAEAAEEPLAAERVESSDA